MEFMDELKKNSVCKSIMNYVDVENVQLDTVTLTPGEATALYNVAFHVYNSFCNDSDEDDGLSKEMNRFLEDLASARDKLCNI